MAAIQYSIGVLTIEISEESGEYILKEPEISSSVRNAMARVYNTVRSSIGRIRTRADLDSALSDALLKNGIDKHADWVMYFLSKEYSEFGEIYPFTLDPEINEIVCNGYGDRVMVKHETYGYLKTKIFLEKAYVDSVVIKLAQKIGRTISLDNPVVSGYHPAGYFIQLSFGNEISSRGSSFAMRREYGKDSAVKLYRPMPESMIEYLSFLVGERRSAIVIGEGCSRKRRLLRLLADFIPGEMKMISITGTPGSVSVSGNRIELSPQEETIFNRRISREMLIEAAMRQRPDYIIIDDVSGEGTDSVMQSIMTGHATYSSMDADDLRTFVSKMTENNRNITRDMIGAIDAVIMFSCKNDRVTDVYEYDSTEEDQVNYNRVFYYDAAAGRYVYSGYSKIMPQEYERKITPGGTTFTHIRKEVRSDGKKAQFSH
ncbi:MAG: ATPase, T2SS/T4P/T4SS family [Thermoplasmata archaeon]